MRKARDKQRESLAVRGPNPGKSVAKISCHRSSSKRGHELPLLLNENKIFLNDGTDRGELFNAFLAKHLKTESEPVPFFRSLSDRTLSTIDVSSDLIRKHRRLSRFISSSSDLSTLTRNPQYSPSTSRLVVSPLLHPRLNSKRTVTDRVWVPLVFPL
ncbi:hypothetical protein SprV_0200696900 [Sparganum proliferum]